jgi:hypothetical protein
MGKFANNNFTYRRASYFLASRGKRRLIPLSKNDSGKNCHAMKLAEKQFKPLSPILIMIVTCNQYLFEKLLN